MMFAVRVSGLVAALPKEDFLISKWRLGLGLS